MLNKNKTTRVRSSQKQSRSKSSQKIIRWSALGLMLSTGVGLILGAWYWLRVTSVVCIVKNGSCEPSVAISLQQVAGTPLFFYNHQERVEKALADQAVVIRSIHKYFPRTLTITVQPEPAVYQLNSQDDGRWLVTESGRFIATASTDPHLPLILSSTQSLSEIVLYHHQLKQLILYISSLELELEHLTWHNSNQIELTFRNHQTPAIISVKQWQRDLALAKSVLNSPDFTALQDRGNYVDSRFDLPVLKMEL